MITMKALTSCDSCNSKVYPDAVFREVPIPHQHGFVALVYKCRECGEMGKIASTFEEWEELSDDFERAEHERASANEALLRQAQFDLDQELTGDLLISWFNSLGAPPIESKLKCDCKDCKLRRGDGV